MSLINNALVRMMTAVSSLRERAASERGQDLLEYALLSGLIAAAITAVLGLAYWTGALQPVADGIAACIDFDNLTPCTS